jgi:hypothetical protein
MSCNPEPKIEYDGLREGGKIYRLAPDMSNAQVAVLATCLYVEQYQNTQKTLEMADDIADLNDLFSGGILTI